MEGRVEHSVMRLGSDALGSDGSIAHRHTHLGANFSPALRWVRPPDAARSFALFCQDHDVRRARWVHWVMYRIPAGRRALPEGIPSVEHVPGIGWQGRNDFGSIGYGGPRPVDDRVHRYVFTLWALAQDVPLPGGLAAHEVEDALGRHVLARAELIGLYRREP